LTKYRLQTGLTEANTKGEEHTSPNRFEAIFYSECAFLAEILREALTPNKIRGEKRAIF